MANWQFELDLSEPWAKADNDEITAIELAKAVVEKLRALKPKFESRFGGRFSDLVEELDQIITEFDDFINLGEDNDEAFNSIFERLYNWADEHLDNNWPPKRVCWVRTNI